MQRNTKVIAGAGLIPVAREVHAVCRGWAFLDDIKGLSLTSSHRAFRAVLEIDGSITVGGHSWRDGFPSYPLAAVRNLAEGRRLLDPAKPTGGHIGTTSTRSPESGRTSPISASGRFRKLMRLPQRINRSTVDVVYAGLDNRFSHGGQRLH